MSFLTDNTFNPEYKLNILSLINLHISNNKKSYDDLNLSEKLKLCGVYIKGLPQIHQSEFLTESMYADYTIFNIADLYEDDINLAKQIKVINGLKMQATHYLANQIDDIFEELQEPTFLDRLSHAS